MAHANVKKFSIIACVTLACLSFNSAYAYGNKSMVSSISINGLSTVLASLQKESDLAVQFPQKMPKPAKPTQYYAYLEPSMSSYDNGYRIDVDTTATCHGIKTCNVGSFSTQKGGQVSMQTDMAKKPITVQVHLVHHQSAYFTPSHAMGDYWPAMIQWVDQGVLYSISWNTPSLKNEQTQLMQMADTVIH
ncbi:MAG: hypothetical protein Q7V63_07915 [Gammaproteobacteria bacterium]|nr:hypothetical protein [Gammaproteobacteria bacterium]